MNFGVTYAELSPLSFSFPKENRSPSYPHIYIYFITNLKTIFIICAQQLLSSQVHEIRLLGSRLTPVVARSASGCTGSNLVTCGRSHWPILCGRLADTTRLACFEFVLTINDIWPARPSRSRAKPIACLCVYEILPTESYDTLNCQGLHFDRVENVPTEMASGVDSL